jgi:hypothetical protein
MQPDSLQDQIANIPQTSMMGMTYSPTFGNISFAIQPSMTGEVSNTFGLIANPPSLEGLLYMQQMQAQITPTNVLPGQNQGQQNMQGTQTAIDGTGNIRVAISGGGTSVSTGSF